MTIDTAVNDLVRAAGRVKAHRDSGGCLHDLTRAARALVEHALIKALVLGDAVKAADYTVGYERDTVRYYDAEGAERVFVTERGIYVVTCPAHWPRVPKAVCDHAAMELAELVG